MLSLTIRSTYSKLQFEGFAGLECSDKADSEDQGSDSTFCAVRSLIFSKGAVVKKLAIRDINATFSENANYSCIVTETFR